MEFEDVQKFILEIRKRPTLWDLNSKDYKNQSLKKDAWTDICKFACPNYVEKSENEKKQIAKDLHMKWKNLRDAYIRHIRLSATMRTEKKAIRIKPYVYAKQMDFLKEVVNYRPRANSLRSMDPGDDVSNDSELNQGIMNTRSDCDISQTTSKPSTSYSYRRSKRRLEDKSISYINSRQKKLQHQKVQSRQHEVQHENDDMSFFRSLLPTLQMFRPEQKLTFRIDVMKLLTTYSNSQQKT